MSKEIIIKCSCDAQVNAIIEYFSDNRSMDLDSINDIMDNNNLDCIEDCDIYEDKDVVIINIK